MTGHGWMFVTPRGEKWTVKNAQEPLRRQLLNQGLPWYFSAPRWP